MKLDPVDLTTWPDQEILKNLRWAESVSWQQGEQMYRWWSGFRAELLSEVARRGLPHARLGEPK